VDTQVLRRQKSRTLAKHIRNQRNRRARREALAVIDNLINEVYRHYQTFLLSFLLLFPPRISFPISEGRFPSLSRYDPVSHIFSHIPIFFNPRLIFSITTAHLLPDVSPLSPSHSSTSSVEFLSEIPAPSSYL